MNSKFFGPWRREMVVFGGLKDGIEMIVASLDPVSQAVGVHGMLMTRRERPPPDRFQLGKTWRFCEWLMREGVANIGMQSVTSVS